MTLAYYDRTGEPITFGEWCHIADAASNRVARTELGAPVNASVSTVHVGLDHGFGRTARPVIFETMVFPDVDAPADDRLHPDGECWRWCTEAEAEAGHRAVVAWLLNKGPRP